MAKENDVVLVYLEDSPVSFARVEKILPDAKKDWYHIKLLMLQIPLQAVTWILKADYINGAEFTMGGQRMRLETVQCPADPDTDTRTPEPPARQEKKPLDSQENDASADIISFPDFKKRNAPESS